MGDMFEGRRKLIRVLRCVLQIPWGESLIKFALLHMKHVQYESCEQLNSSPEYFDLARG